MARPVAAEIPELANAVLEAIGIPMPKIDMGVIPAAPLAPRRANMAAPTPAKPAA